MKIIIQHLMPHSRMLWYVNKKHLNNCLPKLSTGLHRRDGKVSCNPRLYSDLNTNSTSFSHPQPIDYTYESPQGGVRDVTVPCCYRQTRSE
jgi:hypothetical protein